MASPVHVAGFCNSTGVIALKLLATGKGETLGRRRSGRPRALNPEEDLLYVFQIISTPEPAHAIGHVDIVSLKYVLM